MVYSRMKILSIVRISVEKEYGYGYLKEIGVKRANQKEYIFKEADFPRLHLNDIEDMIGYNKDMQTRQWSDKDRRRTNLMLKVIEKILHRRRIIRSLECYVGGRKLETDYKLLTRTD
ncbi:hypothetical protein Tco_1538076 [Tanacetum coccineum]